MMKYFVIDELKVKECDQRLMRMITDCNLPVSIVEKERFHDFSKSFNAHYKPPGRKKLMAQIEEKYAFLSETLKKTFDKLDGMSLITDIWTDTHNTKSYLGLTAHYIDEENFKSAMIGLHELDDHHNSENFQCWIQEMLTEWGIPLPKNLAVIADGEADIKSALTKIFGEQEVLHCFAHMLNLVVTRALEKEKSVTELLTH